MRNDYNTKLAYEKHSKLATIKDGKVRKYFWVIENLDSDLQSIAKEINYISNNENKFDFCASCLNKKDILLRVFNKNITARFGIDNRLNVNLLKNTLIDLGYIFVSKTNKSGPLCLYDNFKQPTSAYIFRLILPIRELYDLIIIKLFYKNQ